MLHFSWHALAGAMVWDVYLHTVNIFWLSLHYVLCFCVWFSHVHLLSVMIWWFKKFSSLIDPYVKFSSCLVLRMNVDNCAVEFICYFVCFSILTLPKINVLSLCHGIHDFSFFPFLFPFPFPPFLSDRGSLEKAVSDWCEAIVDKVGTFTPGCSLDSSRDKQHAFKYYYSLSSFCSCTCLFVSEEAPVLCKE